MNHEKMNPEKEFRKHLTNYRKLCQKNMATAIKGGGSIAKNVWELLGNIADVHIEVFDSFFKWNPAEEKPEGERFIWIKYEWGILDKRIDRGIYWKLNDSWFIYGADGLVDSRKCKGLKILEWRYIGE
jgi:hypothetical protein